MDIYNKLRHFELVDQIIPCLEHCGQKIMEIYEDFNIDVQIKDDNSPLTKADLASHQIISECLQSSGYPIISEESDDIYTKAVKYWLVDPLDGTANYNRGIPISAVSIALVKNNDPVIGVIYDFNTDELYEGSISSKAMMNDRPIFVSDIGDKSRGTLVTGLPVAMNYDEKNMQTQNNNFQAWKKVRMIGSAAIASVYVASGKAELYTESGTNLWDVAAGVAICNAAGGNAVITNLSDDFSLDIEISNNLI